jgi:hypothetical protein
VTHIIRINNATATQLDSLAGVVDPEEIEVKCRLDNAEDDGDGVDAVVIGVETANEPVDAVESAVRAESKKVEGIDDGGDRGLTEEEELGENADGLEDLGEDPKPLPVRVSLLYQGIGIITKLTRMKPQLFSKIIITNGDKINDPPRTIAPSFQAISRSRERGYSHCMIPKI